MRIYCVSYLKEARASVRKICAIGIVICAVGGGVFYAEPSVLAQGVSGVRSSAGGVAPLFNLTGPGSLYIDNQGTQGYIYSPSQNFQSYNFRNPTTGQAWTGAMMTLGPQLSIGLIQGANQVGSPTVLPPPPRQTGLLPPIESGLQEQFP